MTLIAAAGTIGSGSNAPAIIQTGFDSQSGLAATAALGISVEQASGNLPLFTVTSDGGDVWLDAPSGNILDNNPKRRLDTRSAAQLNSLWSNLTLTFGNGMTANASTDMVNGASSIASYLAGKNHDYQQYWTYRNVTMQSNGTYTADPYTGTFTLSTAQQAVYESQLGWTDAQVAAYEAQQSAAFQQLHAEFDPNSTAVYNPNYNYATAIPAAQLATEEANVSHGATWTLAQLQNAVDGGAIGLTSFVFVYPATPNVVAQSGNVTLLASGGVGVTDGTVTVDLTQWNNLTLAQKAALAGAEPSDTSVNGNIVTISQSRLVDVEAGKVINSVAGDNIYLGSQNSNLNIGQVTSGTNAASTVMPNIRIKSALGIVNDAPAGVPNIVSSMDINVTLAAANGSIGSASTPFLLGTSGNSPLTAQASVNDYIQQQTGNLEIDLVEAQNGLAKINVPGSLFETPGEQLIDDVVASSFDLEIGGYVGTAGTPILVQLAHQRPAHRDRGKQHLDHEYRPADDWNADLNGGQHRYRRRTRERQHWQSHRERRQRHDHRHGGRG